MASWIPVLRAHFVIPALAVLTALGPPIGHPAQEVLENRLLQTTGAGHTFYVAPGGSDSADGSTGHPWATIQHAADSIAPGDTVHVAPGQYRAAVVTRTSGEATHRIRFISDDHWGAHIQTTGSDFSWTNHGDYVDIQGFDITGDGRIGILNLASHVQIVGNHVHDIPAINTGRNGGAGIDNANYSAHDSDIIGNVVNKIGTIDPAKPNNSIHGIYIANLGGHVWNNIVYRCQAYGIHAWHAARNATIANNLVFENGVGGIIVGAGDSPGGIIADNFVISNNIVINNYGYGILEEGRTGTHNRYLNNLVYGNKSGAFTLQNGNVDRETVVADPKLINYQSDGTGDYHLSAQSRCIKAGTSQGAPTRDYDGVHRPKGSGFDIGPFEWVPRH